MDDLHSAASLNPPELEDTELSMLSCCSRRFACSKLCAWSAAAVLALCLLEQAAWSFFADGSMPQQSLAQHPMCGEPCSSGLGVVRAVARWVLLAPHGGGGIIDGFAGTAGFDDLAPIFWQFDAFCCCFCGMSHTLSHSLNDHIFEFLKTLTGTPHNCFVLPHCLVYSVCLLYVKRSLSPFRSVCLSFAPHRGAEGHHSEGWLPSLYRSPKPTPLIKSS